jgi:hypothetical protein
MKMPQTQVEFMPMTGGLDLITPPLMMPPGHCREAQNFEVDTLGGYVRCLGYERFDGRVKPSDALHYLLPANVTGSVSIGNTVTGLTSFATGVVIAVGSDRIVFTKATGQFLGNEEIQVAGVTQATSTDAVRVEGGDSQEQIAQYRNLAADVYRADIQSVPGEGQIRGLKFFNGTLYAIRNIVTSTAAKLYKSSISGWTEVSLGEQIEFSNANVDVTEGDTLTQGGVTAIVERVVVESGSLQSGTNAGRLILSGRAGGNFSAGAATSTGSGALTLSGAQTAITLEPNGRYKFTTYNFGAGLRLYGCDGVNPAFEFDGSVYVPIRTGMTEDRPQMIAAHKNHLFLGFDNSLQHSAIADPYNWTPLLGAGELNLGDRNTNLLPMPGDNIAGGAMACFTRNRTYLLYGASSADWQLVNQRSDIGALPYTAQFIETGYFMDDRGITSLSASDTFGNFAASSLSQLIRPWLIENKSRVLDSCVVRDKNQYRLLFNGGRMIVMTLNQRGVAGFMPQLLAHPISLLEETENTDGTEVVFYGGANGMVYQAERGTSFDGEPIEAYLTLAFNHSKSPRVLKQYRKAVFEVGGLGFAQFNMSADLAYAASETPQLDASAVGFGDNSLGAGRWDSGNWDQATWDGAILLPAELPIAGVAQNMGMRITQFSDYYAPLTFYGVLLHFTPRRQLR